MKALILAGGRGKRVNDQLVKSNKCMIEICGKHVIEYSLDNAARTDVDEIIIVVGYMAETIINHYGNHYHGKRIQYAIQREQHGLVHAIECAREAIEGDDFMLMLGDEVMLNPRHQEMIDMYRSDDATVVCGLLTVNDRNLIKRTYAVITDDNNRVYRLIEKPRHPLNDYMGTGDCIFKNEIFDYIEYTPIHHERKEKELPDLIQSVIDDGKKVKTFMICDKYSNVNSKEDIELSVKYLTES